jgi:hypothetical protein
MDNTILRSVAVQQMNFCNAKPPLRIERPARRISTISIETRCQSSIDSIDNHECFALDAIQTVEISHVEISAAMRILALSAPTYTSTNRKYTSVRHDTRRYSISIFIRPFTTM